MHVETTGPTAITVNVNADELAEIIAHHCREHLKLDLPESKGFMRLLSADGQPAKRITVEVKW